MARRARLDRDLVYEGAEDVQALGEDDIPAPDECIRPGAYRWQPPADGEVGHWVPLEARQAKPALGAPSLEQAFYDLAKSAEGTLPPRTAAWCAAFATTIEGKK